MSNKSKILQTEHPTVRSEYLESNADKIEELGYMKPFMPDELMVKKDELFQNLLKLKEVEDELHDIKEQFKEKMKPLKQAHIELLANIKNKGVFVREKCYGIIEEKEMVFYSSDGVAISRRPLLPGEQKTIMSVIREGTND